MRNWVTESEARRRDAALAGLGLAAAFVLVFLAQGPHVPSGLTKLLLIAVICGTGAVLLVGVFVRVKTVDGRPAFQILVPGIAMGGIGSGRSDRTYPLRLQVRPDALVLLSGSTCVAAWPLTEVREVQIRTVLAPRPLGYLTLSLQDGREVSGRVFQPRLIARALPQRVLRTP